jgi:signal peptidase I
MRLLLVLGCALLLLGYARSRFVLVKVRGHSMLPTYRDGQRLLVRRTRGRALRPGEVAVFAAPEPVRGSGTPDWLVKRVAAVAGDPMPLEITGVGSLVPHGHYVVRGDNPRSLDSRHFGCLAQGSVLGVVWVPRRARRPEVPAGGLPPVVAVDDWAPEVDIDNGLIDPIPPNVGN